MSWIAGIWGKVVAGGALLLAVLVIVGRFLSGVKKAGVNEQIAKENIAREQEIERLKKAADAGARVRTVDGGVLDDDPYNRDRRGKP